MREKQKRAVLVIFACDLAEQGAELGQETLARCNKGAEVFNELKRKGFSPRIILSAGISTNTKKFPRQKESMAEMMKQYLRWRDNPIEPFVLLRKLGWGSEHELRQAIEYHQSGPHQVPEVEWWEPIHVVTSSYHVPRIKLLARALWDEDVVTHSAKGSVRSALTELGKLPIQAAVLLYRGMKK